VSEKELIAAGVGKYFHDSMNCFASQEAANPSDQTSAGHGVRESEVGSIC